MTRHGKTAGIKRVVDVLMTLALLFLMGYQLWGDAAHEWAGAVMLILFIVHHILNRAWYKSLAKGRYTPMRVLIVAVDMLLFIAVLAQMYSGIIMSRHVFAFLPVGGGMALARRLHILGAYWGFILMSVHLGLHWNMVARKVSKIPGAVRFLAGLAAAVYGAVVFVSRDFITYMFLQSEFVFLDYEEPIWAFYLDYICLMGLWIFLAHYLGIALKKLSAAKTAKRGRRKEQL